MTSRAELMDRLRAEARDVHQWSNGPGDRYDTHRHSYTKAHTVLRRSARKSRT